MGPLPHQPDRRPMCIALREGPNCQREASWGSGSPNTGTGEGLFPTSLTIALGKSLQGATALVVVQSELHGCTRDTFHKKVKRTNKKN